MKTFACKLEKQKEVILFVLKHVSLFSLAACDDT